MKSRTSMDGTLRPRPSALRRGISAVVVAVLALAGTVIVAAPAEATDVALYGTITGADTHTGIENIQLQLFNTSTYASSYAYTGSDGYYQWSTVPSTGTYVLYINTQYALGGYAAGYYGPSNFIESATTLSLSNTSNMNLSLELPKGGLINGHITFSGAAHGVQVDVFAYNPVADQWQTVGSTSTNGDNDWARGNLPAGNYKVAFTDSDATPIYAHEYYNDVRDSEDADLVTVTSGGVTGNINAELTVGGPSTVTRIAGSNRFETSAKIAETYPSADVVFVANGLGYPDALSAAPAAAMLGAPLLLTQQNSLPAVVKAQIERLNPITIYVVGGTGVVSDAVYNELAPLASQIFRLSGANRYATSAEVFEKVWDGADAITAFLADGRNYPDALASASAAGKSGGPVILVNGGSSTIPAGLDGLLQQFNTEHVALAGGTGVLSAGIASSADALPGIDAARYFGANRYGTSWAINDHFFHSAVNVYLAVGTGYADALAGAALAGSKSSPLYLIPGNCVPQNVLDAISTLGPTHIVLLGGTGVLSPAVEALTPCTV
jgi:putative cell wall-binding protein